MFNPIDSSLFFTKNDPQDIRLGEIVKPSNDFSFKNATTILGYPDDEGIQNSGGRVGAKAAPDTIRKYLYKMTPAFYDSKPKNLFDIGNLQLEGLEKNHKNVQEAVQTLIENKNKVLSLGGGHDYGFPDGAGFLACHLKHASKEKPLVINFDAHLDVRPLKDKITSGTPFYRLLTEFRGKFDFLEIGIQSQCNSKFHYEWAQSHGATILSYDQMLFSGKPASHEMLKFLEPHILKSRPTFVSLDMDCFSSAFAPGCSQVFATGLEPNDFLNVFEVLLKRLDVDIFGIYEASPALDEDDKTTKLAALLAHKFLST